MNTQSILKGILLGAFFLCILYTNTPTANASMLMSGLSFSNAVTTEFPVISFVAKATNPPLYCDRWWVATKIDGSYVSGNTVTVDGMSATNVSNFSLYPYAHIPQSVNMNTSIRLANKLTGGNHTLGLLFFGEFCDGGSSFGYVEYGAVPFTVIDPSRRQDGVCSSPSVPYYCSLGTSKDHDTISLSGNTLYTWWCSGQNGGSDSMCMNLGSLIPRRPVDGVCKSEHYDCGSGAAANFSFNTSTNVYSWSCIGMNGSMTNAACSEAGSGVPLPISATLTATPTTVYAGDTVTLNWTSAEATSCVGTGFSTAGSPLGGSTSAFPLITQDYTITCNGGGQSVSQSVTVTVLPRPLPTVDLKLDGQDGFVATPIVVTRGTSHALTWVSTGATSCRGTSTDGSVSWPGIRLIGMGPRTRVNSIGINNIAGTVIPINNDITFTITCTDPADQSVTDSVSVNIPVAPNVLSLCTESGLTPFAVAGDSPSRSLFVNTSERLKAFSDTDPTDCAGTEVTSTWTQDSGNGALSISGNGTTPQVVTAGPTAWLGENVTLNQGSDTITLQYTIQPPPCVPICLNESSVCAGTLFDASNCGTNNCSGTKDCNYNWREVAP